MEYGQDVVDCVYHVTSVCHMRVPTKVTRANIVNQLLNIPVLHHHNSVGAGLCK